MPVRAAPPIIHRVEKLVNEHRQLRDEPLLLAIYFEPLRSSGDIFLFEVIDGFGAGMVDEDKKFFEVSYAATSSFPMEQGQRLHLVLTSPEEFEVAVQEGWDSLDEVRDSIRAGNAITIFADPNRPDIEAKLNG